LTDAPAGDEPTASSTDAPRRSPFATRDGLVDDGTGVAAHYGELVREQRRLSRGAAVVDLSSRGVLTVTGPDRLSWLNSLTSQSLVGLAPGASAETLLLDANGRLEHAVRLVDDGETAWLLVDGDETEPLRAWLDRMRFMLRVEVADRSGDIATLGSMHEIADADGITPLTSNGVSIVWVDPWHDVVAGGHSYADSESHPGREWSYRETLVARDDLVALAASSATVPELAGTLALEALRIEAWRPRLTTEVDERSIPHELDWMRSAVHLSKGCYRGQETVAKVHNIGHPPRRLVMLHLDGSDGVLPERGADVVLVKAPADAFGRAAEAQADTETDARSAALTVVGHVTSVALHHELGPVALALVKRTTPETAALAVVADDIVVAASQEVIVPSSAGAAAGVPRLPRLGAVRR
jgi:folate-binding protein YgfZ